MATAPNLNLNPLDVMQFTQLEFPHQGIWGCGYMAARHNFPIHEAGSRYADQDTRQVFVAGYLTAHSLREGPDGNRITTADYMVGRFLGLQDALQTLMDHIPLEWFELANSSPVKMAYDRIIEQIAEAADGVETACRAAQIG